MESSQFPFMPVSYQKCLVSRAYAFSLCLQGLEQCLAHSRQSSIWIIPLYYVQFPDTGMEFPKTTDKQTRIYISGLFCYLETVILCQGHLRLYIYVLRSLELILQSLHTPVFPSHFQKVQPPAPTRFEWSTLATNTSHCTFELCKWHCSYDSPPDYWASLNQPPIWWL